jgi:hyperosmotically inducible protein
VKFPGPTRPGLSSNRLFSMSDQDEAGAGQSDFFRKPFSLIHAIFELFQMEHSVFLPAYGEREEVNLLAAHPDSYSLLSSISKGRIEVNRSSLNLQRFLLPLGSLAVGLSLMAALVPRHVDARHSAPGNASINRDRMGPTADQRKMNPSDRALTQKIRKAIHRDKGLSTYGRNIKIFTQDGKVTLRGPVRSEEEKGNLEAKAASVAGQENVSNHLEVAPSK